MGRALGNDTIGETGGTVSEKADDDVRYWEPFPPDLSKQLRKYTAKRVSETLLRVQSVLSLSRSASDERSPQANIVDYLSWEELIHTVYFKEPHSVEFIIFSILKTSGVRMRPQAFDAVDILWLGRWLDQVRTSNVRDVLRV